MCNRVPAKLSLGVGFFPNLLDEEVQRSLPEVSVSVCLCLCPCVRVRLCRGGVAEGEITMCRSFV
jgi:hypothetical protein